MLASLRFPDTTPWDADLISTANWMLMITYTRWAIPAEYLAQDGSGTGVGERPDEVTSEAASGGKPLREVDETGRSPETVIETLASVPVDIERLMEGRSREDLMRPAQDGGWGLVEIIPHFRDWEEVNGDRLTQVLAENPATLEEQDDSLWAIEHGYREMDPREVFEKFAALRADLVERLGELDDEDWQRIVILPKQGRVTLHWLMNKLCDHDAKHLMQARDVLA
jgi:hypothetical protein